MTETRTITLTEENHRIVVTLVGFDDFDAWINVSSTGVTCVSVSGSSPCPASGTPRLDVSGSTATISMNPRSTGGICDWITGFGGWKSIEWVNHVLAAYYVYIGVPGYTVGFSPVTWNDVLGLYFYYINQARNDPSSGNAKTGCGFT